LAIGTPTTSTDPEDIRYNQKTDSLIWAAKAHVMNYKTRVLQNPSLNFMDLKGNFENVTLPENLKMQQLEKETLKQRTLEGITLTKIIKVFTPTLKNLYLKMEPSQYNKGGLSDCINLMQN
jgi:hypothetical protein